MLSDVQKLKIIDEMKSELDNRDYQYTDAALKKIVDEYAYNKQYLLNLFGNHPNWNSEKLMMVFDEEIPRKFNTDTINEFISWTDCSFDYDERIRNDAFNYIRNMLLYTESTFIADNSCSVVEYMQKINDLDEKYRLRDNMPVSKAVNKVFMENGWDKKDGYNKAFAKLSDGIKTKTFKRKFVISLNPMDFLLMSNGNSWTSCHNIKTYEDSGCYSSGTISLMLDSTSFIVYTVEEDCSEENIELIPKLQRQTFAYSLGTLVQLRLYPQNNDDFAESIYRFFREKVERELEICLKESGCVENFDWEEDNSFLDYVCLGENATCYPDWSDYNNSEHCTVVLVNSNEVGYVKIGAEPICISCGEKHDLNRNISCCEKLHQCPHCGCLEPLRNMIYVNGKYYCKDCVDYCFYCNTYHFTEDLIEIDGRKVCKDCLQDDDFYPCERCGTTHYISSMERVNGVFMCPDCASEMKKNMLMCEVCNQYFHKDNLVYDEENDVLCCEECRGRKLEVKK